MTTKTHTLAKPPAKPLLLEIGSRSISTPVEDAGKPDNRDRLDFHDVAVWSIRAALEELLR